MPTVVAPWVSRVSLANAPTITTRRTTTCICSDANRSGGSGPSVAVACHEVGHAAQRQSGYAMMKVRTALVPVVNFTQNTWTIVLLLGLFMNIAGLTTLALIFFSFSVLFQLVTLPVEIRRQPTCCGDIEQSGMSPSKQVNGAKKLLTEPRYPMWLQRSLRSFSCSTLWLATTETPTDNKWDRQAPRGIVSSRRCTMCWT